MLTAGIGLVNSGAASPGVLQCRHSARTSLPTCRFLNVSVRRSKYEQVFRAAQRNQEAHIGQAPAPPKPVSQGASPLQKGVGFAIAGTAAGIALFKLLNSRNARKQAEAEQLQDSQGNPEDSKEYKAAVARVRQAVSVQKAVGFMDASRPAKAIVELKQALMANGLARGPLLHSRHSKEDHLKLYRLHLENTEVPPDFAVLLQLREMLSISEADAEKLETEVFESGSAFSI